jgi:integrase
MRNLVVFGAYTGMRPGELFALEWGDVDLAYGRVHVQRRLYWGEVDLPKSNRVREIALPPPARDRLLSQPSRGAHVFVTRTGRRLSQPVLSGYWAQVRARAGLDFDFYLTTRHYGVALLYRLGLSRRAIAAQLGWSEGARRAAARLRPCGRGCPPGDRRAVRQRPGRAAARGQFRRRNRRRHRLRPPAERG